MCSLFKNKYRIGSKRYPGYDYSSPGRYFVTICTKNKIPCFGKIENGEMVLSEIGKIADKHWRKIPDHFRYIKLDAFIIMPDHLHGIIIINEKLNNNVVETLHATFLPSIESDLPSIKSEFLNPVNGKMSLISPKTGSLGSIIRSYKSVVSKNIHQINPDFSWQSRFNDHIIRTNRELCQIRKYIIMNPLKWDR